MFNVHYLSPFRFAHMFDRCFKFDLPIPIHQQKIVPSNGKAPPISFVTFSKGMNKTAIKHDMTNEFPLLFAPKC